MKLKWIVFTVIASMIMIYGVCFAEPKVEKIDNYKAKITLSNTTDKEGVKTTVTQEKTFTLKELEAGKVASETALKSWVDNKVKCDENIAIQTAQVALWDKLIADTKALGIIEESGIKEPIEEPTEEPTKEPVE